MERIQETSITSDVVDTQTTEPNHPVITGFKELIFVTAGTIQPNSSAYEAAQRILKIVTDDNPNLENLSSEDLFKVFNAAGLYCERLTV
jgi:hypothetical protein